MNFTGNMNPYGSNFGSSCGCGCGNGVPTYQQCNQVVQTCDCEDIPHYMNYHTHGNSN